MRKCYASEPVHGFLEEAYERHFDGREYLDHRCFLWLSFSSKKNVRGGSSGLLGLAATGLPSASQIGRMVTAAEQFGAMLSGNSLLSLRRYHHPKGCTVEGTIYQGWEPALFLPAPCDTGQNTDCFSLLGIWTICTAGRCRGLPFLGHQRFSSSLTLTQ